MDQPAHELRKNSQPPQQLNLLAGFTLLLALLPTAGLFLTFALSFIYPEPFSKPPGHASILFGQYAWVYALLSCLVIYTVPAALSLAIGALIFIHRSEGRQKGKRLAYAALTITLVQILFIIFVSFFPFN